MNTKERLGLSEKEVIFSREKYGRNEFASAKKTGILKRLFNNLNDPIIKILIGALILNLIFSLGSMDISECIGIVIAIVVSTLVSTLSEYSSEKAFDKLKEQSQSQKCRVIRNGESEEIPISEVVVGDAVILGSGDSIPADGFIVSGRLSVDQSALSGESRECEKAPSDERKCVPDSKNALLRGCNVTNGSGIMIVERIGAETEIGKVASDLSYDPRVGPLKERLSDLAGKISRIGYVMAFFVALVYIYNSVVIKSGFDIQIVLGKLSSFSFMFKTLLKALSLSVTIIVVAVPEGLPMMICVVLYSNMKRMLSDNVLVKKLVGIETAGSMNILFCDKTGTLTSGVHSVEKVYSGKGRIYDFKKRKNEGHLSDILGLTSLYNCECTFKNGKAQGSNATDRAIAQAFYNKKNKDVEVIERIPFSSDLKYSAVKLSNGRVIIKGAPEIIIGNAVYSMSEERKREEISKNAVTSLVKEMADDSMRVIAIGESDRLPAGNDFGMLTLCAIVGIRDTIRKTVPDAVSTMNNAGIRVIMLTGDNKDTAISIAKQAGIIRKKEDIALSSDELSQMDDDEVSKILPRLSLIARSLPEDKTRLVKIAQGMGLVVGMTGDGVNDAPALKRADIGFAMGSGTEVAKEAGDIVILNNDLFSIAKAVLYGRTIFKSIRKFIVFQLTMNICAVSVTLIGPFIGIESPITIVQMLWVNLIMDTLGGLAFAGEAPVSDTMKEKPKDKKEGLVNRYMGFSIAFSGIITIMISVLFLASERIRGYFGYYEDPVYFYAAFFCLFIFLGVVNSFNARTSRLDIFANLSKNKAFITIMAGVTFVQLIMVYFGGSVFRAAPLELKDLVTVFLLSLILIPADFVKKIVFRIKGDKNKSGL